MITSAVDLHACIMVDTLHPSVKKKLHGFSDDYILFYESNRRQEAEYIYN